MKDSSKTKAQLLSELAELRQKTAEMEAIESERKQAVDALKRERELLVSSPVVVWRQAGTEPPAKEYVSANVSQFGYQAQDFVSGARSYAEIVHPQDWTRVQAESIEYLAAGMDRFALEYRIVCANGEVRWVQDYSTVSRDESGNVTSYDGYILDITGRKQAEEALAQERNLLRTLLDNVPNYIFFKDVERRYILNNMAHLHSLGVTDQAEVTGKTVSDFHPPDLASQYDADERQVIQSGQPLLDKEEYYLDRTRGEWKWRLTSKVPLRNGDGKIIGLVGICQDITDRKRAEEALKEAHEQLQATLDALPDLLFEVDREGRIYDFRAPHSELLYPSPHLFLGKTLEQVLSTQADQVVADAIARAAETGRHSGAIYCLETPAGPGWFELSIAAKGDPRSSSGRFIMLARDITWRKQAEQAFQRKSRQQEQLLEMARQLTASLDVTDVLTRIGTRARELVQAYGCAIYLLETDGQTLTPKVAIEPPYEQEILATPLNVETSLTGLAVKEKRGLIFNDAWNAPLGQQIPGTSEEHAECVITAPFIVDGQILGAMCLNRIGAPFSEQDLALAEAFATYAAIALKNAQAHHDLEREADRRKRAEEALRQSEALFHSLIEGLPQNIFSKDLDGRVTYANQRYCTTEGKSLKDILGKTDLDLHPPELAVKYLQDDRRVIETGQVFETVEEHQPLGRDKTYVQVIKAPLQDFKGHVTGVIGIFWDITERRQAEKQVRSLNQDLIHRAKELAALNKASRAITSSLDLNGVLEAVIVEVRQLLDAEAASVLLIDPASAGDELVFAAADGPGVDKLMGTRMPATAGIAGDVLQARQSARVDNAQTDPRFYGRIDAATGMFTHSLLAVPLVFKEQVQGVIEAINKTGGPFDEHDLELLEAMAGSAATAIENARLYQAEREQYRRLQDSQARLIQAEKMEALGRLIASIAHEINNPLQAVMGCLELFHEELDGGVRREKLERYLGIVEAETERIAAIVRRVRDFYRPAHSEMEPTDVHLALISVLELADKQLQHSDVTVEREWADELPLIQANPDHLKQVFLNLVINAIDAMAERGGRLRIRTTLDQMQGADNRSLPAVRIDFSDTGAGISPEALTNLFEPFFTTKTGGTGLGLAISYEIIQAHNGQISVTSQVGAGATFTILLPAEQP